MDFVSNKIFHNFEYISKELCQARNEKFISLQKASQKTGINKKYLEAMEAGDFNSLPAGIYGKNFLREYSLYLGLNEKVLLEVYDEATELKKKDNTRKIFTQKIPKKNYTFNFPKFLKSFLFIAIVLVCVIYLGVYLRKIVAPPYLSISEPTGNLTIKDNQIRVNGSTEPETDLKINGELILVDQKGLFSKEVYLKSGLNIISITAQKKYSEKNEIIRKIYVESQ